MSFTSRLLPLVAMAASLAAPAAAVTLSTPLTGGNFNTGIMFDVVVGANALTLNSIAVDVNGGTSDFQFYTITGGLTGFDQNAGAWTLRDTIPGVTGTSPGSATGNGTLQLLDVTDFVLAANTTYGFYITAAVGTNTFTRYTNQAFGSTVASNGDLLIQSGFGKGALFGTNNNGRAFNGSITYNAGAGAVPEPASWALLIAGFGLTGAMARRRRTAVSA